MTRDEFQTWCDYLSDAFPDTGRWLGEQTASVRGHWYSFTFSEIELVDAKAAVDAMFSGKIEKPQAYNREDIPRAVAQFARREAYGREQSRKYRSSEPEEKSREPLAEDEPTMAEMYRERLQKRLEDPNVSDDAKARLRAGVRSWSKVVAKYDKSVLVRNDRFKCWTCRDTGQVAVCSAKMLQLAVRFVTAKISFDDLRITEVIVCCTCASGDKAADRELERVKRSKHYLDRKLPADYDPMRVDDWRSVLIANSDTDTIKAAIGWAQDYVAKQQAKRAATEAPYEAFAEYNAGAPVDEF